MSLPAARARRARRRLLTAGVGVAALLVCQLPASAGAATSADPNVQAALNTLDSLGIGTLASMPSGRAVSEQADSTTNFGYRTYADYNAEMQGLAAAYPDMVQYRTSPHLSIEGRAVHYLEITNHVAAQDGKPVFFSQSTIHGDEQPAAEDNLEFAYDVLHQAQVNPAVKALLDHVRLIDMPVVNVDGLAHFRRANCDSASPLAPPLTCPASSSQGVDMNRNYPFGWGSNIGVTFAARGAGPGSEPEVQNTMDIIKQHQVVDLITGHGQEHAMFYPPFDLVAGDTPELSSGYRDLALAMAGATNDGYTNVRDSAHDYETSGETNDWSYYATRGLGFTFEITGLSTDCNKTKPALPLPNKNSKMPNYANCVVPDYTGTPGPSTTPNQAAAYGNHPLRNAYWLALVYASLPAGHSVVTGTAPAGTTLKVTKDFDLYSAPVKQNTTPASSTAPIASPTHLESSMLVPADGHFTWDLNPSVRATPAFRSTGEVAGPNGFLPETWTVTCTTPAGVSETRQVLVDKGQQVSLSLCQSATVGGTVPSTLGLTVSPAASLGTFLPGVASDYTAALAATVTTTAENTTLSVQDPSATASGHLVNGAYSLPQPLQLKATDTATPGSAFAPLPSDGSALPLLAYPGPATTDPVGIVVKQPIAATDAVRTGTYAKTLLLTLSTTTP